MLKRLMLSRHFAPLFWTQFLSALNDNFIKNCLVILILFSIGGTTGNTMITVAGAVLMAPFFLFSALGGEWADKYDKALIARRLKFAELEVSVLGAVGFALSSVDVLMVALGLFSTISALFGPLKYGILPDQLAPEDLVPANGLVEAGTFAAILIGLVSANFAVVKGHSPLPVMVLMMGLALACWLVSRQIPPTTSKAPELVVTRNPWVSTMAMLRDVKSDRRLWEGTHIVSWFWLVGGVALSLLPALIADQLGANQQVVTLSMLAFAIGVAAGSLGAARASHGRPNLALVPIGGFMMALGCALISLHAAGVPRGNMVGAGAFLHSSIGLKLLGDLFLSAIGGGLWVVPSFAAVQGWAQPAKRARVIAAVNVVSSAYIVVASLIVALLQKLGISASALFGLIGAATVVATLIVLRTWGREPQRDFA